MATQAEPTAGDTQKSSMLAFPVAAIIGSVALHKWATARLTFTLGSASHPSHGAPSPWEHNNRQELAPPTPPAASQQLDVTLVAQVTAAVMAALRANGGGLGASPDDETTRHTDDSKPYSTFQLAKLIGFCCVLDNCDIPPIWDYFRSTKDVDAHRTKLLACMGQWARENEITITRGIYFKKSTMDEITKLEFNPGLAAAYFATAKKGISILIVRP